MAKLKINKDFKKITAAILVNWNNARLANSVKAKYLELVRSGVSPVKGQGRFKKYSDSYVESIKGKVAFRKIKGRVVPIRSGDILEGSASFFSRYGKAQRPVNLTLTGQMLRTVRIRRNPSLYYFEIDIDSPISEHHNNGTSKMPRRALIPKEGEEFTRVLEKHIESELEAIIKKAFK